MAVAKELYSDSRSLEEIRSKTQGSPVRLEIVQIGKRVLMSLATEQGLTQEDLANKTMRGEKQRRRKTVIKKYMIAAWGAPDEIRPTDQENAAILGVKTTITAVRLAREARILWRQARGLPIKQLTRIPKSA